MNEKLKKIAAILGLTQDVESEVEVQLETQVEPENVEAQVETVEEPTVELTEEPVVTEVVENETVIEDEIVFQLSEEEYDGLVNRIAELENLLETAVTQLSELKASNVELSAKVVKLSNEPADEPIKPKVPKTEPSALRNLAALKNQKK